MNSNRIDNDTNITMNLASMLNGDPPTTLKREDSSSLDRPSQSTPVVEKRLDQVVTKDRSASPGTNKRKLDEMQGRSNGSAKLIRPPFEPSFTAASPDSDIALKIKQFVLYFLTEDPRTSGKQGIEIEAKLGQILDRDTGARIDEMFPLITAAVLHPNYPCRFQADMTSAQHKAFNQALNEAVQASNQDKARIPIVYKHTHWTDSYYADKQRVTTDDKTGEVVECISKEKIDDLHILCPMSPFDIRITVNLEHPIAKPEGGVISQRKKDRLTYTHQNYQIDLTQVKTRDGVTHELEIELTRIEELRKQAIYSSQGLENGFDQLMAGFIGTITLLPRL